MIKALKAGIIGSFLAVVLLLSACTSEVKDACGKNDNYFVFATWAAGEELKEFNEIVDRVNASRASYRRAVAVA